MIALDTCVLARLIVGDDPAQQEVALELVESNDCSISWAVLVELTWVLERSLSLPRPKVATSLGALQYIERFSIPNPEALAWCIERYSAGADFADMVHLAAPLGGSTRFATFDHKLAGQAGQDARLPVTTLRR